MWKCPVCNTINEDNICCKKCGLDQSRNYTACRTFYPLSLDATSAFEKEKKRSAKKLRRGDSKLIQEIAAAVRKLEELSAAIKNLEEEPASMEKLEKILASIQNYELEKPVPKEKISSENQLMAATNPETIFGKKIDRKTVASVTFLDSKKEAGRDAWDVSEKQNGSVLAWTKKLRMECWSFIWVLKEKSSRTRTAAIFSGIMRIWRRSMDWNTSIRERPETWKACSRAVRS